MTIQQAYGLKSFVKALVFVATISAASGAQAQGNWRSETPLPVPRFNLAAVAGADGTIFAIGGQEFNGYSASVDVYRPSARRWVPGPPLPTPRSGHAAARGGDGRLYVVGGVENGTPPFTNSVLALSPGVGAAWTSVAPLPTPRFWLGAASGADGKIYVVGGVTPNGEPLDVVEIYDPSTNTWSTGAPLPVARYGLGVARGGDGRIYAIGGTSITSQVNLVHAYSSVTNSWTLVARLPVRRSHLAATASSDGLIYAIGGTQLMPDGTPVFTRRVDVYSPFQNRWWTLPQTQQVHMQAAAATGRQRVFAVGGLIGNEGFAGVESRPSFCVVCQ